VHKNRTLAFSIFPFSPQRTVWPSRRATTKEQHAEGREQACENNRGQRNGAHASLDQKYQRRDSTRNLQETQGEPDQGPRQLPALFQLRLHSPARIQRAQSASAGSTRLICGLPLCVSNRWQVRARRENKSGGMRASSGETRSVSELNGRSSRARPAESAPGQLAAGRRDGGKPSAGEPAELSRCHPRRVHPREGGARFGAACDPRTPGIVN